MKNKSHLTALSRRTPSAPMQWLDKRGWFSRRRRCGLDYGCGKGFDADHYQFEKYDSYYHPRKPTSKYDVIVCNYVLNVIDDDKQILEVLVNIRDLLSPSGIAYVTVRRDIKTEGYTSRGTYQRNIVLDFPIAHETSKYCIYYITK